MNIILLTGGSSKRFGSDKSQAQIDGKTLLEIIFEKFKDEKVIVVGPEVDLPAIYLREDPIGGGPVAAIGAAINSITSEIVAIVAVDMPFVPDLVRSLTIPEGFDAVLPIEESGRAQPLSAVYRTAELRHALSTYEELANQSMMSLIGKLKVLEVKVADSERLLDIDTQADLKRAIERQNDIS